MSGLKVSAAASLCLAMTSYGWAQEGTGETHLNYFGGVAGPRPQFTFEPPEGWRPVDQGDGVIYYDAPDVPVGACWIAVFPAVHLSGNDFRAWYEAAWDDVRAALRETDSDFQGGTIHPRRTKDGSYLLSTLAFASTGDTHVQFTAASKGSWAQAFLYAMADCGLRESEGDFALLSIGGGLTGAAQVEFGNDVYNVMTNSLCMNSCATRKSFCTNTYPGECQSQYSTCTSEC
jgi:hypothetical protein